MNKSGIVLARRMKSRPTIVIKPPRKILGRLRPKREVVRSLSAPARGLAKSAIRAVMLVKKLRITTLFPNG
jgi:hypothetical protein